MISVPKTLRELLVEYNFPELCKNPEFKGDIDEATKNSIKAVREWLLPKLHAYEELIEENKKFRDLKFKDYPKAKLDLLNELLEVDE